MPLVLPVIITLVLQCTRIATGLPVVVSLIFPVAVPQVFQCTCIATGRPLSCPWYSHVQILPLMTPVVMNEYPWYANVHIATLHLMMTLIVLSA